MSNSGISRNLFWYVAVYPLLVRFFVQYLPRLEFLVIVDRSICQGWGSWWRGVHWCGLPWHWMMIIGFVHPPRFTDACLPNTPGLHIIGNALKCNLYRWKIIFSNTHMAHMLYLQHNILRATKVEHLFWESDSCFPSPFYDLLKIVRYAFKRNKVYFCFAILFLYNKGFGNYEDPPMLGKFSNTQKLNWRRTLLSLIEN